MATVAQAKTKEYVRPIPATWWLKHPGYVKFMVRELSSVFIAAYCVFLLVLMYRAGNAQTYDYTALAEYFHETLREPLAISLHLIALFFALFNTVTFIHLTPRVVVIQRGEERVPDWVIIAMHYGMLLLATAGLILLALQAKDFLGGVPKIDGSIQ